MYHSMSLRLMAYLGSVDPHFDLEGHTGFNPEEVAFSVRYREREVGVCAQYAR